jgi:hypothetical protein
MSFVPVHCSRCLNSVEFHRSHLHVYDWVPWLLFLRPYRCDNCYHRFYVWGLPKFWRNGTKSQGRSHDLG